MGQQDLSFAGPPSLAIAEGASTPDPGYAGARLWSTTLNREMIWNGSNWKSVVNVFAGTTAPTSPQIGDLWIDTN